MAGASVLRARREREPGEHLRRHDRAVFGSADQFGERPRRVELRRAVERVALADGLQLDEQALPRRAVRGGGRRDDADQLARLRAPRALEAVDRGRDLRRDRAPRRDDDVRPEQRAR